jgi:Xaa-Pro aminopeptidase
MSWPGVRFDDAEYAQRHERLQAAMAAFDLDALVLSDDRHTWYATGFGDIGPIGSAARPRILVLPATGPPVFFVHHSTRVAVGEMSAVPDVRTYRGLGTAPVGEIASLLRERGARRVGAELGGGMRVGTTVDDLEALRAGVDELVDASPALWSARAIKSPAEAERVRTACAITSAAYAAVFPALRPGMTERDVAARLRAAMAERGAHSSWVWVVSGPGEFDRVDGVTRVRELERGDLVFVDMGACVGGYWADFSRAAVVGHASEHQRQMQQLIAEVTMIGTAALVPGRTTGEVARLVDAAMDERGLVFSSEAGRYGHGLGMAVTEYPDVAGESTVAIEPGMVLTMEPGMWTDEGMFHCEHNVLVTPAGNEILSDSPLELTEAG